MIISRAPLRVSFLGGGTDLPSFYCEEEGAVLSTTISKYVYITINDRFDNTFRLSYSKTEIHEEIAKTEHPIFALVLRKYEEAIASRRNRQGGKGLELISMADVPAGSGLGSSSSFTVALLHALKSRLGVPTDPASLAEEASHIEIEELGAPIGKQDQYAAAFGGLTYYRFLPNGKVIVEPVRCSTRIRQDIERSIMMFYTGTTRPASSLLTQQKANTHKKRETLREMRELALRARQHLENDFALASFGKLLQEGWKLKKTMADGITDGRIDDWYQRGCEAGAWGGKILGAGGGGFLLFLASPEKQGAILSELKELRRIPVQLEESGAKIIFRNLT